jgi:hypothetical protein
MVSIGHQTAVDAVRPALAEIDFNLDGVVNVRWPVVGSAAGSRRLLVSTLPHHVDEPCDPLLPGGHTVLGIQGQPDVRSVHQRCGLSAF